MQLADSWDYCMLSAQASSHPHDVGFVLFLFPPDHCRLDHPLVKQTPGGFQSEGHTLSQFRHMIPGA